MAVRTPGVAAAIRIASAALALAAIAAAMAILVAGAHGATALRIAGIRVGIADASRPLWIATLSSVVWLGLARGAAARRPGAACLALTFVLACLALARRAEPTPPVGDIGVIEVYIFEALHGRLFLGPYSRFLWHHPGPIYFFLLAPFYVLSGYHTAGVAAGVLSINIASMALLVWVARRHGGRLTAAVLAVACACYGLRFPRLLTSQWNPHALVFPTLAALGVAAAVATGAVELIPVLFAIASFAAQTHLGLAPMVAAVTAAAFACAFVSVGTGGRRRFWWNVNGGAWVAAVLWLLPVVEQLADSPGNLTRLWQFFTAARGAQPSTAAFAAWAGAVTGAVTPSFRLAWGGAAPPAAPLPIAALASVLVAALAVAAAFAWRRGVRYGAALAAVALIGLLAALWSTTRIAGEIIDHEVFWMSGVGLIAMAALVLVALDVWRGASAAATPAADIVCALAIAILAVAGVRDLQRRLDELARPGDEEIAATTLSEELVKYGRDQQPRKMLVKINGEAWTVAAGVLVELDRAGVPYAVDSGAVWMFGDGVAPDGTESRTVQIAGYAGHASVAEAPGVIPLAARRGFFADLLPSP